MQLLTDVPLAREYSTRGVRRRGGQSPYHFSPAAASEYSAPDIAPACADSCPHPILRCERVPHIPWRVFPGSVQSCDTVDTSPPKNPPSPGATHSTHPSETS